MCLILYPQTYFISFWMWKKILFLPTKFNSQVCNDTSPLSRSLARHRLKSKFSGECFWWAQVESGVHCWPTNSVRVGVGDEVRLEGRSWTSCTHCKNVNVVLEKQKQFPQKSGAEWVRFVRQNLNNYYREIRYIRGCMKNRQSRQNKKKQWSSMNNYIEKILDRAWQDLMADASRQSSHISVLYYCSLNWKVYILATCMLMLWTYKQDSQCCSRLIVADSMFS